MNLVDTHCHLDLPLYEEDRDGIISSSVDAGVVRMIVPGINLESSRKAIAIAEKYPEVYAACGIHPHEADSFGDTDVQSLQDLCQSSRKVVAIGEVGLDYYRMKSKKENQKKLLASLMSFAGKIGLPLILHNRDADEDFFEILDAREGFKGVFHCFSGSRELLEKVLDKGFYVSFTGTITFDKTGRVKSLVENVPPERLLLETDAPYMSPRPLRGKRNVPENVRYLLQVYADIYGLSEEDIARITTHNANTLFDLGIKEQSKIAYAIRSSLYLNITRRCTSSCTFCTREISDFVKGHNLAIEKEPDSAKLIQAMGDLSPYREIVFCGFGEPTLCLDVIKEVASYIKKKGKKVRLVTNGHGNLIHGRSISRELKGLVDVVSVSLNAADKDEYNRISRPQFGEGTFDEVLNFIKDASSEGMEVEITCLDFIGTESVDKCRKIAGDLKVKFRLRKFNVVG